MTTVATHLRAVAAFGLRSAHPRPAPQPLDDATWQELVSHVRWQRITHLLASSVGSGVLPATSSQTEEAIEADEAAISTALRLEQFLLGVGAWLDRAGVTFRVLKGPAVAHIDYPDPVWRGFGDIDLLIPPDHLDQTVQLLTEHGFTRRFPQLRAGFDRRFTKSVSMTSPDGQEIDLHRTLTTGGFGQRISVDALWQTPGSTFVLAGRRFTALGPEERLLHACYHAVLGNSPPRLAPLRDVAQMLTEGDVDPSRARALATAWQGEAAIAHAITTAQRTLDVALVHPLAEWANGFVAPPRQRRDLARATSPGYTFAAQAFDGLRAIGGTRQRAAYLFALAFPQRGYIRGRHSGFADRARHALTDIRHVRTTGKETQP
jgi:hypothetical protein